MLTYINRVVPAVDFMLSEVYVSLRGQRPSLTAVQLVRFADENIYLRSASINTCNGYVSLHFSCDGSH